VSAGCQQLTLQVHASRPENTVTRTGTVAAIDGLSFNFDKSQGKAADTSIMSVPETIYLTNGSSYESLFFNQEHDQ
jgi:hypothetical protein